MTLCCFFFFLTKKKNQPKKGIFLLETGVLSLL